MTPRSFFSGLWRGLDGLRKVLHLIMLLAILAVVVGLLRAGVPRAARVTRRPCCGI